MWPNPVVICSNLHVYPRSKRNSWGHLLNFIFTIHAGDITGCTERTSSIIPFCPSWWGPQEKDLYPPSDKHMYLAGYHRHNSSSVRGKEFCSTICYGTATSAWWAIVLVINGSVPFFSNNAAWPTSGRFPFPGGCGNGCTRRMHSRPWVRVVHKRI